MDIKKEQKTFFGPQLIFILLIVLGFLIFNLPSRNLGQSSGATLRFFDVGQGDASLITTSTGQNILIDGGPSDIALQKLDSVFGVSKKELGAVIITHPHADHITGLIPILNKYEVKDIYLTGVSHTAPEYIELLKIIEAKKLNTHQVVAGDAFDLGQDERLNFLYPDKDLSLQKVENLNNTSVVVQYIFKNRSAIFLGDLETEGQAEMLKRYSNLSADVLRVAHHGSKDSINEALIKLVNPNYAVIQVGKDNKFGHPSKDTLATLAGRNILRTDYDGDIKIQFGSNGMLSIDKEK